MSKCRKMVGILAFYVAAACALPLYEDSEWWKAYESVTRRHREQAIAWVLSKLSKWTLW